MKIRRGRNRCERSAECGLCNFVKEVMNVSFDRKFVLDK